MSATSSSTAVIPDRSAMLRQFAELDSQLQLSFLVAAMIVHGGGPRGTSLNLMCSNLACQDRRTGRRRREGA